MFKNSTYLFAILFAFFGLSFTACNNEDDESPETQIDNETIVNETEADVIFDEIDAFAAEGILLDAGSRTKESRIFLPECAQVNIDLQNQEITIDFGDGCEGRKGYEHAGIIKINYTDRSFIPGSEITTTLVNYSVNGHQVEGTRVVKNISESLFSNLKFEVTLTNGKVTFSDGSVITREVSRIREWVRTTNPLEDQFLIYSESTASGTNRNGEEYNSVITSNLVYTVECALDKVFLPVSGNKEVTVGDKLYKVSFGDGTCDNIITVEHNGFSIDIDLSPDSE